MGEDSKMLKGLLLRRIYLVAYWLIFFIYVGVRDVA